MNIRVAIRVDASFYIGNGHVMRCIALADQLVKEGSECIFIIRRQLGDLTLLIEEKGYKVCVLPEHASGSGITSQKLLLSQASWLGCSWELDAAQTLSALEEVKPDWLIVDHYGLDQAWEEIVGPSVSKLMVIDDLADRFHTCDVLLDQSLGRKIEDYDALVPEYCKCLIGPEYAVLRSEFKLLRKDSLVRRKNFGLKNLFVSMGGVDKDNTTISVLNLLDSCVLPKDCIISVVMGADAPWLEQVNRRAESMTYRTEVSINVTDMAKRMSEADLSIGAAGGTSWERCALGLPSFLMLLADNQVGNITSLVECGAAQNFDQRTFSSFLKDIPKLKLQYMSIAAASLCQGDGAMRVARMLLVGADHCEVSLSPVTFADCDYIYSLQTQPAGRNFFRNIDVPSYAQHCLWYEKRLSELNGIIFKIKFGGINAGAVRVDNLQDNSPEISIIISSEFAGRGIGTAAIYLLCELFPGRNLSAVVHARNYGSLKLFGKAGFVKVKEDGMFSFLLYSSN